ncbi:MAG TPA: hypothetical protein VFT45_24510 [Longimicrobium sp.]|nr:hypothetical protein [Longimicrobium sp.]
MHLRRTTRHATAALTLLFAAVPIALRAQGGPPMLTDDPGTPGNGNWELNVAFTAEVQHGARAFESPLLDLNYGVGERIQLKVEGPWLVLDAAEDTRRSGLGDLAVGVKWRFMDQQGARLADVSVYPQVAARTLLEADSSADGGRPLQVLLPLEVAHSFGRASANAEVGYAFGADETELIAGLVVGWELGSRAEALAEFHQTSVRTTGENERFADVGVRGVLGPHMTLLASAGHSVGAPTATWIGYFGLQLTS